MLVIDCKNMKRPIHFNRETIMVMCYAPKIIVFQTAEEIWRFQSGWEKIVDYLEEVGATKYIPVAKKFDNKFRQQSKLMIDTTKKPNKLKAFLLSENDNTMSWTEESFVAFGVEDSMGLFITLDEIDDMCELISYFKHTNSLWNTTKKETQDIFMQVWEVFEEEIENRNKKDRKIFNVDVVRTNE